MEEQSLEYNVHVNGLSTSVILLLLQILQSIHLTYYSTYYIMQRNFVFVLKNVRINFQNKYVIIREIYFIQTWMFRCLWA